MDLYNFDKFYFGFLQPLIHWVYQRSDVEIFFRDISNLGQERSTPIMYSKYEVHLYSSVSDYNFHQ